MTLTALDEFYAEVNILWNSGKNPTLRYILTPKDPSNNPDLIYINLNTIGLDETVNSAFIVTSSFAGDVKEGNPGNLGTLELTSGDYSSQVWFEQIANQLNELSSGFFKVNGTNYFFNLEIYVDGIQIQSYTSLTNNTQYKVKSYPCSRCPCDGCC